MLLTTGVLAAVTVMTIGHVRADADIAPVTVIERGPATADGIHGGLPVDTGLTGQPAQPFASVEVSVRIDDERTLRTTQASTVRDLLVELGVVLGDDTAVSHDLDAPIVKGLQLVIARIDSKAETASTEVPFETAEVLDPTLPEGERVVRTAGIVGEATTTYLVRYVDGVEVLRTKVVATVRAEPRDEVVRVGTKPLGPVPTPTTPPSGAEPETKPSPSPDAAPTSGPIGGSDHSGDGGAQEPGTGDQNPDSPARPSSNEKPTPTPVAPVKPAPTQAPKPTPSASPKPTPPTTQEPDVGAGKGQGTSPASAKVLAKAKAAGRGWGRNEQACLVKLWQQESGWNFRAKNPSSTARGIPQAMMSIHFGADWRTDPAALAYLQTPAIQIDWGLNYIAHKHGTPCAAQDFSLDHGWY